MKNQVKEKDRESQLVLDAMVHHRAGRNEEAVKVLKEAVLADPLNDTTLGRLWNSTTKIQSWNEFKVFCADNQSDLPKANYYLGLVHERLGEFEVGATYAQRSIQDNPNEYDALILYARLLLRSDKLEDAIEAYKAAESVKPEMNAVFEGLAICFRKLGRYDEACALLINGTKKFPFNPRLQTELSLVYGQMAKNTDDSSQLLLMSDTASAAAKRIDFTVETEKSLLDLAPKFPSRFELHYDAIDHASVDGLVLEFGVASGTSIRMLAERMSEYKIYGFDSFEGLPESWESKSEGMFSRTSLPEVPPNTELVVGWYDEVLEGFLKKTPGNVRYLHIDCDLYSSTAYVMTQLAKRIVAGTIIVFDEYWRYSGWTNHEFRALKEFCEENNATYEILGTNSNQGQVSVKITSIENKLRRWWHFWRH